MYGEICDSGLECQDGVCVPTGTLTASEQCIQQGGEWDSNDEYCTLPDQPVGVNEDLPDINTSAKYSSSPSSDIQDTVTKHESLFWWITAGAFVTIIAGTMIYYSDIGK